MLNFKQFLEDHEDPNGELQAGMAASGANTVADGPVRQKFMGSDKKKITLNIKVKKPWEISRGHAAHRSGAGTHEDKRFKRTRGNNNQKAIDDSSG